MTRTLTLVLSPAQDAGLVLAAQGYPTPEVFLATWLVPQLNSWATVAQSATDALRLKKLAVADPILLAQVDNISLITKTPIKE